MRSLRQSAPLVGIGFRMPISEWTVQNLDLFDVLEITIDHYLDGGETQRAVIRSLVGRVPLIAHGIGLSIGTDVPLARDYLERVATAIDDLEAPSYSEHLAFTRVPGRELGNLLPLPKTRAVAEDIIGKVRAVQTIVPVPFSLENISHLFEWPDSELSDAEFFNIICGETGAGLLLDVENLYVNSHNLGFDPCEFLDALPAEVVTGVHAAGGVSIGESFLDRPVLADSHSHPVPDQAVELLGYALGRQKPATVIVERDDRMHEVGEIVTDVARLRDRLSAPPAGRMYV
jgi:uncharacterized protein (UPF0276 family)